MIAVHNSSLCNAELRASTFLANWFWSPSTLQTQQFEEQNKTTPLDSRNRLDVGTEAEHGRAAVYPERGQMEERSGQMVRWKNASCRWSDGRTLSRVLLVCVSC